MNWRVDRLEANLMRRTLAFFMPMWIAVLATLVAVVLGSLFLLAEDWWGGLSELDTRKVLALQIAAATFGLYSRIRRGA